MRRRGLDADGRARHFLTALRGRDSHAHGRPVGVTVVHDGAPLVAGDVADTVWRVAPAGRSRWCGIARSARRAARMMR